MSHARSVMTAAGVAAAALVLLVGSSAVGQFGKGEGTWPRVSVSVARYGNLTMLEGRTLGQTGQVIWRQVVAGADVPVTLSQGWMTSFVTVGQRQFVVDNATGQVQELGQGEVFRRVPPGIGTVSPESYGESGSTQPPPPVETLKPSPGNIAAQRVSARQQTVEALYVAQADLLRAMAIEDNLPPDATPAQRAAARLGVEQARADVRRLEQQLMDQFRQATTPQPTSAPRPETVTEQDRLVQLAQNRVTDLAADAARAEMAIGELRSANADDNALAAAQARADRANADLVAARRQLAIAQMNAQFPPPALISPDLRARIGEAERAVIDQMENVHIAQANVRQVRQAMEQNAATQEQLALVGTHLLAALQKLNSAQQELEDLRQTAVFFQKMQTGARIPVETRPVPWPPLPAGP